MGLTGNQILLQQKISETNTPTLCAQPIQFSVTTNIRFHSFQSEIQLVEC